MKNKEAYKTKILEYIGNPDNDFPNRQELASEIGITKATLYKHFSPEELYDLEITGLELRRKRYAPRLSKADLALIKKAEEGDVSAIKLCYQRFEDWAERKRIDQSNTGDISVTHGVSPEVRGKLDEIYKPEEGE
jgi:hypothetical protein